MPESEAHKRYMKKYRKDRKNKVKQEETAAVTTEEEWRTRRHKVMRPDGKWTTDHLFERRNQLILRSERRMLTEEEEQLKVLIDTELRTRHELAPLPTGPTRSIYSSYEESYTRLGLTEHLPKVLEELNRDH